MKITAIPAPGSKCDSLALRQAIGLTLNETRIVCPHCGDYQATPQSSEEVYVCCTASGDIALWEAIPDLMALQPEDRDALFTKAILQDFRPQSFNSLMETIKRES